MSKKLLIVVDYQVDFVTGSLGFKGAELLDKGIARLIYNFKDEGHDVVATIDTHYDNYLSTQEGKYLPTRHCMEGTKGHELFGDTKAALDLCAKHKFTKSTFGSDHLYEFLVYGDGKFHHGYDEIHFVGLVSNICVISNAVLAKTAQSEAKIIIHSHLTSSYDSELNKKALDVMEALQMEVR